MIHLTHDIGSPTTGGCWRVAANLYSAAEVAGAARAVAGTAEEFIEREALPVIIHICSIGAHRELNPQRQRETERMLAEAYR